LKNNFKLALPDMAWSFDAQGPVKGTIKVIVMQRDMEENLL